MAGASFTVLSSSALNQEKQTEKPINCRKPNQTETAPDLLVLVAQLPFDDGGLAGVDCSVLGA